MMQMTTNKQLKDNALLHLNKNWGKMAMMTLLIYIICASVSVVLDVAVYQNLGSIISILLLPLYYGYYVANLNLKRRDTANYDDLWVGFKEYFPVLLTMLLKGIYTLLWTLLLIVPGIMKSYSYAMTEFVMADDPSLRYDSAIEKSMRLMEGHKMQLFLLDLSMIGWAILSLLTLGIGFLFLVPYNMTAHAEFYDELLRINAETANDDTADKFANL